MGRGKVKATSGTRSDGILRRPCGSPTEIGGDHDNENAGSKLQDTPLPLGDSENDLVRFILYIKLCYPFDWCLSFIITL